MQYSSPQEAFIAQLLMSGQLGGGESAAASVWLSAAYLICLFSVITFKPERVRNLSLFRRACWFYAMSILAPSLVSITTNSLATATGGMGAGLNLGRLMTSGPYSPTSVFPLFYQLLFALGPVLFGISVLCALISIVPTFIPPPDVEAFVAPRELRPSTYPVERPPVT